MARKGLFVLAMISVAALGRPFVLWDESIQGDLSGNHLAPDQATVNVGSNLLIGSTGFYDRDYFHFSLAPGQSLAAIYVNSYVSVDDYAFLAVQEGTVLTEDPDNANPANLLGWTLWGTNEIGTDILPLMGNEGSAIGFNPPLTGADYTFWLQQTGDPTDYVLDFRVVPEPTTLVATSIFFGMLARSRRKKSR